MIESASLKLPILAVTIAALWLAESLAPHFIAFVHDVRARRVHALRNAALALINGGLGILVLGGIIAASVEFSATWNLGALRALSLPAWPGAIAALLVFDCWMYWWHRMNHKVPFLWRFHRVHHSDPRMDVTTALRFHPGEIILSTVARLFVVNLIGMDLWHIALYELVSAPIIAFHHSNIAMPRLLDNSMRWIIVTPWMHWVHHSREREETNSNYASLLSIWDRIFRSYRLRKDPDGIVFGLDEFPDSADCQRLAAMIETPLK